MKYPCPDLSLYKALIEAYFRCLKNKKHVKKDVLVTSLNPERRDPSLRSG